MAASRRGTHWTVMQPAHRDRDPQLQLSDQLLDPPIGAELGLDPQAPQGLDLGAAVDGVAMGLQPRQVAIMRLARPGQAAGFEDGGSHGAGGGEAHPQALDGGAVALAEVGNRQLDRGAGSSANRGEGGRHGSWALDPEGSGHADKSERMS